VDTAHTHITHRKEKNMDILLISTLERERVNEEKKGNRARTRHRRSSEKKSENV
jgi:hypothetical protein